MKYVPIHLKVPAMIIGIPVWVGRKLHAHYRLANKHKRNTAITAGVMSSVSGHALLISIHNRVLSIKEGKQNPQEIS